MKTNRLAITSLILVLTLGIGSVVQAQRGRRNFRNFNNQARLAMVDQLDLSDEQKEQLKEIRDDHQEKMNERRNILIEKKAHLNTLMNTKDRDLKAINNAIDDIHGLEAEIQKNQIANREECKKILTEEQLDMYGYGQGRFNRGFRNFNDGRLHRNRSINDGRMHLNGPGNRFNNQGGNFNRSGNRFNNQGGNFNGRGYRNFQGKGIRGNGYGYGNGNFQRGYGFNMQNDF